MHSHPSLPWFTINLEFEGCLPPLYMIGGTQAEEERWRRYKLLYSSDTELRTHIAILGQKQHCSQHVMAETKKPFLCLHTAESGL